MCVYETITERYKSCNHDMIWNNRLAYHCQSYLDLQARFHEADRRWRASSQERSPPTPFIIGECDEKEALKRMHFTEAEGFCPRCHDLAYPYPPMPIRVPAREDYAGSHNAGWSDHVGTHNPSPRFPEHDHRPIPQGASASSDMCYYLPQAEGNPVMNEETPHRRSQRLVERRSRRSLGEESPTKATRRNSTPKKPTSMSAKGTPTYYTPIRRTRDR